MPWASEAQRRFGNSPAGIKKIGAKKVAEFNAASKGLTLPDRLRPKYKTSLKAPTGKR